MLFTFDNYSFPDKLNAIRTDVFIQDDYNNLSHENKLEIFYNIIKHFNFWEPTDIIGFWSSSVEYHYENNSITVLGNK